MYGLVATAYQMYAGSAADNSSWSKWNGTADFPFSPLGDTYNTYNNSISTIKIDDTRWLLIAGSDNPTVSVGKIVGGVQVYGTPVQLDSDINASAWFRGVQISNGKIYIYYYWYNGTNNVNYAKICNIDISDNITFGARSAQIGTAGALNSPISKDVALSANGHPVHAYSYSGTSQFCLITTTINIDDTITINTEKNFGTIGTIGKISCQNENVIFLFAANNFYAIDILGSVIGNIIDSIEVYPSGEIDSQTSGLAFIDNKKTMVVYEHVVSGTTTVSANIVTYDSVSLSLSVGTQEFLANAIYAVDALQTNNSKHQVIASFIFPTPESTYTNAFAVCLTPSGSSIISAPIQYPIDANWWDISMISGVPNTQSAVMNTDMIVSPFISYDEENYGTTVLNRVNTLIPPVEVIHIEADDDVTTAPQTSLGNTVATINSTLLGIISPNNYESVLLKGTKLLLDNTNIFTVVSADSTGAITLVIVEEKTPSYSNVPCSLLGITSWGDGVIDFDPVGGTQIPSLGEINNKPSVIFYSTNTNAYLESNDFSFPMTMDTTLFMVCKTLHSSQTLSSFKSANLTPLMDITSEEVLIYPPNISVGSYTLSSALALVTVVRTNGAHRVYINGVLNATLSTDHIALAIGNPVTGILGNNFATDDVFQGYMSAVALWYGALSDSARIAQEEYYLNKYNIAQPPQGFALLSGGQFNLLSGQRFDLLT